MNDDGLRIHQGVDAVFRRGAKPRPNEPAMFGPSVREPQKTLEINRRPVGGGTSRELNSLQCSFRDDDGTWKLKFVPGYVRISTSGGDGEIVPGIGGVAIDAEDPPELSVVNANRIYLKVTASFTSPQSATVTIENLGASTPNSSVTSTGFTGYFFIAQFFEGAGSPTLNQGQGGNVQVMVWGASIFFWRL